MIYIGGAQRTSTGYLWGIVAKILNADNKFKAISKSLSLQNRDLKALVVDEHPMDIIHPLSDTTCSVLMLQHLSATNSHQFMTYQQVSVDMNEVANNATVFQTHMPMGFYMTHEIDQYISHYFFIHRNALDECVSIVKAHSITESQCDAILASEILPFDIKNPSVSNINYKIYTDDMKFAFSYFKTNFFNEIRDNALNFLTYKNKNNVFEFSFERLTISNELNEIERIAKILNIESDSKKIYMELKDSLQSGNYWNAKGQKTNTANAFFDIKMKERLHMLLGDIQVVLGYLPLWDYSQFIYEHSTFKLVFIGISEAQIKQIENIFIQFNKTYTSLNIMHLEDIVYEPKSQYIFFTENYLDYLEIKNRKDLDSIVYPYYEALFCYDEPLFSITDKKQVNVSHEVLEEGLVILDSRYNDATMLQKCNSLGNKSILFVQTEHGAKPPVYLDTLDACEIYLFGTGKMAKNLYKGITEKYKHITIKGFIDSSKNDKNLYGLPILHVNNIQTLKYDYIVIAFMQVEKGLQQLRENNVEHYFALNDNFDVNITCYHESLFVDKDDLIDVIGTRLSKCKRLIVLSFNLTLIRKICNAYYHDCTIFSLIPMYNYDSKTLLEFFNDKRSIV